MSSSLDIAVSLSISFVSALPSRRLCDTNCPLSLPALRPAGWEKRERRTSCWMRTMTCGSLWDINTLLRCQRELLQPNDRALTQAAVTTTGVAWHPPPQTCSSVTQRTVSGLNQHARSTSFIKSKFSSSACLSFYYTELWLVLWKNSQPVRRWTLEKR